MRRKYYNIPGHIHYVTFSCYRRQQLLDEPGTCGWLAETIDVARSAESFLLYACVFMPEHVHLLIHPTRPVYSMSQIMRRIKETFTRRVVAQWEDDYPEKLALLRARFASRTVHRFWQPGGGYDRNLYDPETINRTVEYIEFNPVRRGLVTEPAHWKWSSARARSGHQDISLRVDNLPAV
jgi:putative transposase